MVKKSAQVMMNKRERLYQFVTELKTKTVSSEHVFIAFLFTMNIAFLSGILSVLVTQCSP
jgi:hypothetical protein